uniref:RGS domain-containing protein n=1 Tax=Culex tarsalis TaxID=7177 RepID=A0A1Q3FCI2_CULTA
MLQFLKKSAARRRSTGHGSGEEDNVNKAGEVITNGGGATKTMTEPVSDEEALREAERYWMDQQNQDSTNLCAPVVKSRLSRNLLDILAEQSCICYFVQFLETKRALPLVKFWLEVEGFKAAAAESVRLDERIAKGVSGTVGQHRGLNRSVSSDNYDSVSFLSVDCDSISTFSENAFEDTGTTTDDPTTASSRSCTPIPATTPLPVLLEEDRKPASNEEAMRQSLTDDEKLKLEEQPAAAAATNVQQNGGGFNSLVISDAVRIYRKFLASSSPYYIEVPATILSAISLALCGGGNCSERIFDDVQQYLVEVMEKNHLNAFLESGFYCKYTFEVLSSDSLTLKDILCSEMALFYFMEYLEQKSKRHTLEFCVSASHFHRTTTSVGSSGSSSSQAQADAVVLYQKYFSLQATCSLTLSDKVRFLIEEQICSQDVGVIKRCFELPSRIVERFLDRQYFQGFLKSPLYAKFLSELVGKIGSNPAEEASGNFGILAGRKQIFTNDRRVGAGGNQRRGHRKTFSDVTSDSTNRAAQAQHSPFISSQNTLLAMPDASFHRKRLNPPPLPSAGVGSSDLMLIDSRQLYNPDLLWRRNSVAGLTFGRVDALGRYERDFDIAEPPQDDDRWSKNRLKKAMRKLVNLPEDKAQEELAWQVAEMIVKDITSVTLSGGSGEMPPSDIPTSTASS